MSTEWGYFCKRCQKESDTWFNHGEDKLEQYYQVRQLLKDKNFHHIDFEPTGGKWAVYEMIEFLDAHEGHEICLINEYGKTKDFHNNNNIKTDGDKQSWKTMKW